MQFFVRVVQRFTVVLLTVVGMEVERQPDRRHQQLGKLAQLRGVEMPHKDNRPQRPLLRLVRVVDERDSDEPQLAVDHAHGLQHLFGVGARQQRQDQRAQILLRGRGQAVQPLGAGRPHHAGHRTAVRIEHQRLGNAQVAQVLDGEVVGHEGRAAALHEVDRVVPVGIVARGGRERNELLSQDADRALALAFGTVGLDAVKRRLDDVARAQHGRPGAQSDDDKDQRPGFVLQLHMNSPSAA